MGSETLWEPERATGVCASRRYASHTPHVLSLFLFFLLPFAPRPNQRGGVVLSSFKVHRAAIRFSVDCFFNVCIKNASLCMHHGNMRRFIRRLTVPRGFPLGAFFSSTFDKCTEILGNGRILYFRPTVVISQRNVLSVLCWFSDFWFYFTMLHLFARYELELDKVEATRLC